MLFKVFVNKDTGEELSFYSAKFEGDFEEEATRGLLAYERGLPEERIGVKIQNRRGGYRDGERHFFRYADGRLEGPGFPEALIEQGRAADWMKTEEAELLRLTIRGGEVVKTELIKDGQAQEVDWF